MGDNGLQWPVQHTETEIMYGNRYAKYTLIFYAFFEKAKACKHFHIGLMPISNDSQA
jgi:hypothetical protein